MTGIGDLNWDYRLEPPGLLALHHGAPTPVSVVLAHAVYGAILGTFYTVPGG